MIPHIKLISLNIEGDKHLSRVIPFLKKENADVICLQEVLKKDVNVLKKELGMHGEYASMLYTKYQTEEGDVAPHNVLGMLTLTTLMTHSVSSEFYVNNNNGDTLPVDDGSNVVANRKILVTEVIKDDTTFKIINTHFTWSIGGQPTPLQHDHLDKLFKLLDSQGEFVICGDFNAPRGRAVWERIASRYTDNIPESITTTLDQNLHKVKGLMYVVDGMFSTKAYTINSVKILDNISDHMGIIGIVTNHHL